MSTAHSALLAQDGRACGCTDGHCIVLEDHDADSARLQPGLSATATQGSGRLVISLIS